MELNGNRFSKNDDGVLGLRQLLAGREEEAWDEENDDDFGKSD